MNGMDHQRYQVGLAAALQAAEPLLGADLTATLGSLADYVEAVRSP